MFSSNGINHAANLPSIHNEDLQVLLGTRLAEYVIFQYRRTLAVNLFLQIDSDVDLCRTITYLCEDHDSIPSMSDSAIDGSVKRTTLAPPKTITFHGFCKGGFETKLSVEQLECIEQSDILNQWYNNQLATAVDNGKNAIMARFYRHLLTNAHPKNTGSDAGLTGGGNQVGSQTSPVLFDPANADKLMTSILNVIKQMPRAVSVQNEFGVSADDAFFFGPQVMESVFMQVDDYNRFDSVGDCANCSLFSDVFKYMPRGIMPITSFCVESRTCLSGGDPLTIYPVLFGMRYQGSKASLRVKTYNYMSLDKQSIFYRVNFYHHIHTFDPRFLGVAWITVKNEQPATVAGCDGE